MKEGTRRLMGYAAALLVVAAILYAAIWWGIQQTQAQNERVRIRRGTLDIVVKCTGASSPCEGVFVEVIPTVGENSLAEERRGPFPISVSEPLSLSLPLMWDGTDCKELLVKAYMVGSSTDKSITLCEGETQDVLLQV